MTEKHGMTDQAVDAAKQLAPWSTKIPWWVVLIEGIVVGAVGLMVVFDPQGANVTIALALSFALVVAGLMQLWAVFRSRVPEKIDSVVAARAAIAVYAGLMILVLYFIEGALTRVSGFGAFSVAALIYGLLALVQVVRTGGNSRRQALIEFLLFTSVGVIGLWGLFNGGESIVAAIRIVGWIFIIGGVALIALAIWRQQKGDEADEMIDSFTDTVGDASDKVTSIGQREDDKPTAEEVAEAVQEQQEKADE